MQEIMVRYSEAFKLRVVRELEQGKLTSILEAQRRYGIRGSNTIRGWLKKFGISRQAYYKVHHKREKLTIQEELLLDGIKAIRQKHERMGGRKLLNKLGRLMAENNMYIGRDCFFQFLRRNSLLIRRRKKAPYTTDSRHGLRTCLNLLKDIELTAPHQAWVSDITYIRTWEGSFYLSLITDACSREIISFPSGILERLFVYSCSSQRGHFYFALTILLIPSSHSFWLLVQCSH